MHSIGMHTSLLAKIPESIKRGGKLVNYDQRTSAHIMHIHVCMLTYDASLFYRRRKLSDIYLIIESEDPDKQNLQE